MPWKTREEIPDRLKNAIEPPPLSIEQANAIAEMAEALEREGKVDSPWAVAIAHFKKYYVKSSDGNSWVKREKAQSEAETIGRKGGPEAAGSGGCLAGPTKVPLLDGRVLTMESLARQYPDGGIWVYSCKADGKIVPGYVEKALSTQYGSMLEIGLDGGKSVICTPDHLFLLRSGRYQAASELYLGDSIMPLYRRLNPAGKLVGYEQVLDNKSGRWKHTHSIVRDALLGGYQKGMHTHHKDYDKLNNDPSNLVSMKREEHFKLHASLASELWHSLKYEKFRKEHSARHSRLMSKRWKNPAFAAKMSVHIRKLNTNPTPAMQGQQIKWAEKGREWLRAHPEVASRTSSEYMNREDYKTCDLCGRTFAKNASYAAHRGHCLRQREQERIAVNHEVVYIRPVGQQQGYDLQVKDYNNFALDAGAFVHNSCKCPECGAAMARMPKGEETASESEAIPTLTLSLPAVQRLMNGELSHIVHMGDLEAATLAPVVIVHENKVYAKVILSRPVCIGADIYSYNVKILEVYDPPLEMSAKAEDVCTDARDSFLWAENRVDLTEAQHSRSRCMQCNESPVIVVHWADGRGKAWFCLGHFRDWIAEGDKEIVRAWHVVSGEVPEKFGEGEGEQVKKLQDGLKQDEILKRVEKLENARTE